MKGAAAGTGLGVCVSGVGLSETYCCLSLEPSLPSILNETVDDDSVAGYSLIGMDTSLKLMDKAAIERAAMSAYTDEIYPVWMIAFWKQWDAARALRGTTPDVSETG